MLINPSHKMKKFGILKAYNFRNTQQNQHTVYPLHHLMAAHHTVDALPADQWYPSKSNLYRKHCDHLYH